MHPQNGLTRVIALGVVIVVAVFALAIRSAQGAGTPTVSPTPGPAITAPFIAPFHDLALFQTSLPSTLQQQNLLKVIADQGYHEPNVPTGQLYQGKAMTVTALFGLGTVGRPGATGAIPNAPNSGVSGAPSLSGTLPPACVNWQGPCNIPVRTSVGGQCSDTGQVIPRIEKRPLWIVDLGNAPLFGSRHTFNHSVFVIDDVTGNVIEVIGWDGP